MLKSWILLLFVLVTVCQSHNTIITDKNIIPSPRIVILVRYFFVRHHKSSNDKENLFCQNTFLRFLNDFILDNIFVRLLTVVSRPLWTYNEICKLPNYFHYFRTFYLQICFFKIGKIDQGCQFSKLKFQSMSYIFSLLLQNGYKSTLAVNVKTQLHNDSSCK